MILSLLLACTGDVSNAVFIEDARFRAAFPDAEALTMAWPVELTLVDGAEPDPVLLQATLDTLAATQLWVDVMGVAVSPARLGTPTERGEDFRVWGPYPWDDYPGYFLRVEMSRTANQALYTFAVGVSNASSGPWTEFFNGTTVSDSSILAGWDAELVWDVGRLSGEMSGVSEGRITLRHASVDARLLELEVEGWRDGLSSVQDSRSTVATFEDGSGRLNTAGDLDLGAGTEREHIQLVSQWALDGAGRADAVFSGGDLGEARPAPSQCWSPEGAIVWQDDPTGTWPLAGELAACPAGIEPGDPDEG